MRIGYSKIGRSWCLDPAKASTVGGDLDQIRLLKRLAHKHPEHEFFLIGRGRIEISGRRQGTGQQKGAVYR